MRLGPRAGATLEPVRIGIHTYAIELETGVVWTAVEDGILTPTDPEVAAWVMAEVMDRCVALGVPTDMTLSEFVGQPMITVPEGGAEAEQFVRPEVPELDWLARLPSTSRRRAEVLIAVLQEGTAQGWAEETADGYRSHRTQAEVVPLLRARDPKAFPKYGDHEKTLSRLVNLYLKGYVKWGNRG